MKELKDIGRHLYAVELICRLILGKEATDKRIVPHIKAILEELKWVGVKADK